MSVVIIGRLCTICMARGALKPAVNIATDAEGLEWYECEGHGAGDHAKEFGDGLMRVKLESAEAFFERHFGKKEGDGDG